MVSEITAFILCSCKNTVQCAEYLLSNPLMKRRSLIHMGIAAGVIVLLACVVYALSYFGVFDGKNTAPIAASPLKNIKSITSATDIENLDEDSAKTLEEYTTIRSKKFYKTGGSVDKDQQQQLFNELKSKIGVLPIGNSDVLNAYFEDYMATRGGSGISVFARSFADSYKDLLPTVQDGSLEAYIYGQLKS